MKHIHLFTLLLTLSFSTLMAQDDAATEILTKWKNASQYTINLIDSMPAEHFDFKPTPEIKSFSEQVTHIVDNMTWLSNSYLG
ncbi:MAG: DinB family protein, partial [Saprospiraceae bacterium]